MLRLAGPHAAVAGEPGEARADHSPVDQSVLGDLNRVSKLLRYSPMAPMEALQVELREAEVVWERVRRPARAATYRIHDLGERPREPLAEIGSQTIFENIPTTTQGPDPLSRIRPLSGVSAVGVAGFEPTTSSSRTKRAAKLRYTPVSPYCSGFPPATGPTLADASPGDEIRFRERARPPKGRSRALRPWEPVPRGPLPVPGPFSHASRGTRVSRVASGGQAKRTGVKRLVPQPAETCR